MRFHLITSREQLVENIRRYAGSAEEVLEQWSNLIEQGHPQYDELHDALAALFARHGKTPNALARISIVVSDGATEETMPTVASQQS
jgi:glutamate/tyrosine decarboxylase-like PLP-dependent enzyme